GCPRRRPVRSPAERPAIGQPGPWPSRGAGRPGRARHRAEPPGPALWRRSGDAGHRIIKRVRVAGRTESPPEGRRGPPPIDPDLAGAGAGRRQPARPRCPRVGVAAGLSPPRRLPGPAPRHLLPRPPRARRLGALGHRALRRGRRPGLRSPREPERPRRGRLLPALSPADAGCGRPGRRRAQSRRAGAGRAGRRQPLLPGGRPAPCPPDRRPVRTGGRPDRRPPALRRAVRVLLQRRLLRVAVSGAGPRLLRPGRARALVVGGRRGRVGLGHPAGRPGAAPSVSPPRPPPGHLHARPGRDRAACAVGPHRLRRLPHGRLRRSARLLRRPGDLGRLGRARPLLRRAVPHPPAGGARRRPPPPGDRAQRRRRGPLPGPPAPGLAVARPGAGALHHAAGRRPDRLHLGVARALPAAGGWRLDGRRGAADRHHGCRHARRHRRGAGRGRVPVMARVGAGRVRRGFGAPAGAADHPLQSRLLGGL
ncbi:MAG: hypothetical protein AVDCRST_MAG49-2288, partial [uncultured Thermomicrobiales bacterium]